MRDRDQQSSRRALRGTQLKRFLRDDRRARPEHGRLALVLENVLYPVNVGSCFRVADACDIHAVVLAGATPDPAARAAVKAGRGKAVKVGWRRETDGASAVRALRAEGYWVAALELTEDSLSYEQVDYPCDVALVVGNEDQGVSRATLAECDAALFVPMFGSGLSLNVHVAAAVVAYRVRLAGGVGSGRHWRSSGGGRKDQHSGGETESERPSKPST